MTKFQMVINIAEKTGVEQVQVRQIVQLVLDRITDVIATEGRIELRDFGVFEVVNVRARKGRNPRTGQQVNVAARNRVRFKAGKVMAERVGQSGETHS